MSRVPRGWTIAALSAGLVGAFTLSRGADGSPEAMAPPVAAIGGAPAAKPGVLVGDGSLRGTIDFDRWALEGDHYVAPIKGGGKAQLTLDPKLQKAAESVLGKAKAPMAAIVVTSLDGRVLAYAGLRDGGEKATRDLSLPASVWAPAASIFKIVTSAALLSRGVKPDDKVCYHGGLRSVDADHLIDNPKRDTICESLSFGLAQSQNAIIAKLTHRHLDRGVLRTFAEKLGFHRPVATALPADSNRCDFPKDPLEFARTSAGFWNSELSTLGGAMMASAVASRGLELSPRIVDKVVYADGTSVAVVGAAPRRVLEAPVADNLAAMMERAVSSGTARKGFYTPRGQPYLGDIKVAGKTGSLSRNEPTYLGYSWFVGFAPVEEPRYVISVLLANPMKWHLKAHTAARLVLQEAFSGAP